MSLLIVPVPGKRYFTLRTYSLWHSVWDVHFLRMSDRSLSCASSVRNLHHYNLVTGISYFILQLGYLEVHQLPSEVVQLVICSLNVIVPPQWRCLP